MSSSVRSKNVPIEVFQLARTAVDRAEVRRWLDNLGATEFEIPAEEEATDAALLVALAAKQCYMSFQPGLNKNVTKVRSDMCEYLDNVMKQQHGSVLEHAVFSYGINNVSRVFTGEMNRHRAGIAISERSMRYIRFEDCLNWWLPPSLQITDQDDDELRSLKYASQAIFHETFSAQSENYAKLVKLWDLDASSKNFHYKKTMTSCFRRIIGMGAATGGVWTGNVRALRHVFTMRCAAAAEEEICHVFTRICADMATKEPMLFGDFQQNDAGFWTPKYVKV